MLLLTEDVDFPRAALDMLKKSVRQGGNRKMGGGKDVEGADAPEQLRKLQLQVITGKLATSTVLCLSF